MKRRVDDETQERAEQIVREEGQPHGRDADIPGRGTATLDKREEDVIRANEAAHEQVGGAPDREPGREAGKEALGARLGSTASVERSIKPLSNSDSSDTSESASSNRYGRG